MRLTLRRLKEDHYMFKSSWAIEWDPMSKWIRKNIQQNNTFSEESVSQASFSLLTFCGKCFIHSQGFSLERAHCYTNLGQPFSELHPLLAFSHIWVISIHVKIAGFGALSNFFLKLSIRLYGVFLFFWVNKFFPFFLLMCLSFMSLCFSCWGPHILTEVHLDKF